MELPVCILGYKNDFLHEMMAVAQLVWAALVSRFAAAMPSGKINAKKQVEQNLQAERLLDDYGNSILRFA